jgi:hypothetical protein
MGFDTALQYPTASSPIPMANTAYSDYSTHSSRLALELTSFVFSTAKCQDRQEPRILEEDIKKAQECELLAELTHRKFCD